MKLTTSEIINKTRTYNLAGWHNQNSAGPLAMVKSEGLYFWDVNGKRYLDWSSMQLNVNLGHAHSKLVKTIQKQAGKMTCLRSSITTENRAKLGENLARITPIHLRKNYLTHSGADALESALKIARLYTGRQKIIVRCPSLNEEILACSGPYRLSEEFSPDWLVKIPDPSSLNSPAYVELTPDEYDHLLVDLFYEKVNQEGPQNLAGIVLSGCTSEGGIIQGGEFFWRSIQEICRKYGILLIVDENLSGFGRMGEWFASERFPFIQADIMVLSNGITGGYIPLGAVMVSDRISEKLGKNTQWCGLNYNAHALACSAALAAIEVYEEDKLIRNAKTMGMILKEGLQKLAAKHPIINAVRGSGLFYVIELVKQRPITGSLPDQQQPFYQPMLNLEEALLEKGLSTIIHRNRIINAPPLPAKPQDLQNGLQILDEALTLVDDMHGVAGA